MSDDLTKKRPQDAQKINVNQQWELEDWSKKLGCSQDELKAIVKRVGCMADDVRRELKK